MTESADHAAARRTADTFVYVAPNAVRMCSGLCGEVKVSTSFPTVSDQPGVRYGECRACRDERLREHRPAASSHSGEASLPPPVPPHVVEIIERRWQGLTLREIGAEFGLTRERVRQLLMKHEGPSADAVRHLRAAQARSAERTHQEAVSGTLHDALDRRGPMTAGELAEITGLEASDVSKHWPEELAHLRLWGSGQGESRWTDEDIYEALRRASIYEFPLSTTAYSELLRIGQIEGPSVPRIWQRFGSWTTACAAAGVVASAARNREYDSKWSDEELLQLVRSYLMDPDAPNSARRFDEWKRANAPDGPSAQTLRNRFGSWNELKRRALARGGSTT